MILRESWSILVAICYVTLGAVTVTHFSIIVNSLCGVNYDARMTVEKPLRSVSRAAAQNLCIMRMSRQVLHDRLLLARYFFFRFLNGAVRNVVLSEQFKLWASRQGSQYR